MRTKGQFLDQVVREMQAQSLQVSPGRMFVFIQEHYEQEYADHGLLFSDLEKWMSEQPEEEEEPRYLGRRVENLGANVSAWSEKTGNGSSTFDLCKAHAEQLDENPHRFDAILQPYNGDPPGEDGRGDNVEHPDYDECDYRCAIPNCRVLLGGW